jgi:hypothetical protein
MKQRPTYGIIGFATLRPCKGLESLGLMAHGAFDLDDLLSSARLAVDGGRLASSVVDLRAKIGELLG